MPTYCFICPECERTEEVVIGMRDRKDRVCECGSEMVRDYCAERPNIGDREYRRPIHSDSLAIMPHQVAEHKRKYPNINIDNEGRPIFTSFRQHDQYLKDTGFVKHPQRIRRRGKKIATAQKAS